MKKTISTMVLSLGFAVVSLVAGSNEFKVGDPLGRNTVQFRTSAPLEDIVGTTSKVAGRIVVDPDDLKNGDLSAIFEVELASLDTGIALRDTHMRDNFLQTAQHPKAIFSMKRIVRSSKSGLKPNKPVRIVAEGTFSLHGVEKQVRVPVEVTYLPQSESTMGKLPGNLLRITSQFPVRLSDYDIERPQMLMLKVGEVAQVDLDLFATDATPEQMTMWMEQMKKMMAGM